MNAGYLFAKWIKSKLDSMGYNWVIQWLAGKVGTTLARNIVSRILSVGVTAAASYIATLAGTSGALAGLIGAIVGFVGGWL